MTAALKPPSLTEVRHELARRSLRRYFELARGFTPAKHQVEILEGVQRFLEQCWNTKASDAKGFRILNVNVFPGAGKSSIISSTLPTWVLGKRPYERIGVISAKGDLVQLFEQVVKVEIEGGELFHAIFDPLYPERELYPDHSRKWANGSLYIQGLPKEEITPSIVATSLGGSVLGKRFTMLICDDIQDQESARTPAQRRKVQEFLTGTVLTRVIPGSPIINVQQRWAEGDASDFFDEHYDAQKISIPALTRDERTGEWVSAWPDRYSPEYFLVQKRANPPLFAANYQQDPASGEGDIFKAQWFKYYDHAPPKGQKVQSWDTALSEDERADYTAMVEGVITPQGDVYVTDFYWKKLDFVAADDDKLGLIPEMKRLYERSHPRLVLIEDKASGKNAAQVMRRLGIPVTLWKRGSAEKTENARSSTGWLEAGKVFFPANHPLLAEFEAFLKGFPLAKYDDPVDALVQLLLYVIANPQPSYDGISTTEVVIPKRRM